MVGNTEVFECPLGERAMVERTCDVMDVWSQFDQNACGDSISGQLNNLVDLFSNVRQWITEQSDCN